MSLTNPIGHDTTSLTPRRALSADLQDSGPITGGAAPGRLPRDAQRSTPASAAARSHFRALFEVGIAVARIFRQWRVGEKITSWFHAVNPDVQGSFTRSAMISEESGTAPRADLDEGDLFSRPLCARHVWSVHIEDEWGARTRPRRLESSARNDSAVVSRSGGSYFERSERAKRRRAPLERRACPSLDRRLLRERRRAANGVVAALEIGELLAWYSPCRILVVGPTSSGVVCAVGHDEHGPVSIQRPRSSSCTTRTNPLRARRIGEVRRVAQVENVAASARSNSTARACTAASTPPRQPPDRGCLDGATAHATATSSKSTAIDPITNCSPNS